MILGSYRSPTPTMCPRIPGLSPIMQRERRDAQRHGRGGISALNGQLRGAML